MAFKQKNEFISGADSIPDVIKVETDQSLIDPNKTEGKRLRGLFGDFLDTMFGLIQRLTGNGIRGIDQKVSNLTRRDAINSALLVVGQRCYVSNNTTAADAANGVDKGGAEYYLLRDSSGPLTAFIDADQGTTATSKVRWVLTTGTPAQIQASYALYVPSSQPIAIGDVKRYTVPNDVERLYLALVAQPLAGNGVNNTPPTGSVNDPNWLPFSPITAALKPRIYLSLAGANGLLATSGVTPGQPYAISLGKDGILLIDGAVDSDHFAKFGELFYDDGQGNTSSRLVKADIPAGTFAEVGAPTMQDYTIVFGGSDTVGPDIVTGNGFAVTKLIVSSGVATLAYQLNGATTNLVIAGGQVAAFNLGAGEVFWKVTYSPNASDASIRIYGKQL